MKRIAILCAALAAIALIQGCARNAQTLIIASQTMPCYGVGLHECMLAKESKDAPWEFFYGGIEGFDYRPGYEYVLRVKTEMVENTPQDAGSIRYVLVKVVSKEQKDSAGLPPAIGS